MGWVKWGRVRLPGSRVGCFPGWEKLVGFDSLEAEFSFPPRTRFMKPVQDGGGGGSAVGGGNGRTRGGRLFGEPGGEKDLFLRFEGW